METCKTGNFNGTNGLIYRRSDGINVAVMLNRTSREELHLPCGDDAPPPAGQVVPTWDIVNEVGGEGLRDIGQRILFEQDQIGRRAIFDGSTPAFAV